MIHLLKAEVEVTVRDELWPHFLFCVHRPRQERVKAGVFEKLIRVELSMKMLECRYALQISSGRETPSSRIMVDRSRKKR